MRIFFGFSLLLASCTQPVANSTSPAQVSAPAPTPQQKKVGDAANDCGWGVANPVACSVHPEKENSSKK